MLQIATPDKALTKCLVTYEGLRARKLGGVWPMVTGHKYSLSQGNKLTADKWHFYTNI